jgi:autotransporter-associated beta strand protein
MRVSRFGHDSVRYGRQIWTAEAGRLLTAAAIISALAATAPLRAGNGIWIGTANSTWSTPANWAGGNIAFGTGATAWFTNNIGANRVVTLDGAVASRTLGKLNIADSVATHYIFSFAGSGNGTLTFNNNAAGAEINHLAFGSGNNTIFGSTLPLVLADNLKIANATANRTLTISGGITGTGNLTLAAAGGGPITLDTTTNNPVGYIANTGAGSGLATISSVIGGNVTGIVQQSSTSTLLLSGNNAALSGGVSIRAGTLRGATSANCFGTGTITLGAAEGSADATLSLGHAGPFTRPLVVAAGNSGAATLITTVNSTYSGPVTLNQHHLMAASGSYYLTMNGSFTGEGSLTLASTGVRAITITTLPVDFIGTVTNAGSGSATTVISGGVGTNITGITQASATSPLTISTTALSVNADGTSLVNAGGSLLTLSAGTTGTGDLRLRNNSVLLNGITVSTLPLNHTGNLINEGTGTGSVLISGGATNVASLTQNSGTSALTVSGAVTAKAGGATLANGGGAPFSITGNVAGPGSLTLRNDSPLDSGITLSGTSINIAGAITNRGSGTGSVLVTSALGANVTRLIQDSATSRLVLTGNNTYGGGTRVEAGTLQVLNATGSGTGTGAVILNDGGTLLNEGTVAGTVVVNDGALLSGNGSAAGVVTNANGGTIAPSRGGGAAGAGMTMGSLSWNGGGVYHCRVTSIADSGAGPGVDYSRIVVSGSLNAVPGVSNLIIRLDSLEQTLPFATNHNYSLQILTYGTAPGLDLDDITLDTSDFLVDGIWALTNLNNAIYVVCMGETPTPTQNFWIGSGNWSTAGNWSLTHAPLAGEEVVFDFRSIADCTGDIVNDGLGSLTLAAGYSGTLTFRTKYPGQGAFTNVSITGDCTIDGGTVTHLANAGGGTATDRLMLTVQGDLLVGSNGRINVDGKGYAAGVGPGFAHGGTQNGIGASHGGLGGAGFKGYGYDVSLPRPTYGDYAEPATLGSGGSARGGGCALIRVGGLASVYGAITASAASGSGRYSGPTGGSIQLIAGSLAGNGSITASGRGGTDSTDTAGGGGGGRIAVILTAGDTFGTVACSAPGGKDATKSPGAAGTVYLQTQYQDKGEGVLIVDNAPHAISPYFLIGTLMPEPSDYNAAPDLSQLASIIITNQGRLILNTNTVFDFGVGNLATSGFTNSSVVVAGTNGIRFPSAFTVSANYQLLFNTAVAATGNWIVPNGAVLSHFLNYDKELYKFGLVLDGNLTIAAGGAINVDGCGYKSFSTVYSGPAAGGTTGGYGSGYGGMGGVSFLNVTAKPTYGSVTAPFNIGSGASYPGNGAIFLDIRGTTTLNGSITSRLTNNVTKTAGSSGGSIWLTTRHLIGNGMIDASGKPSSFSGSGGTSSGGGGGGGRISVVVTEGNSLDGVQLKAPGGRNTTVGYQHQSGAAGTIYTRTANQEGRGCLLIANDNWDMGLGVATNTLTLLPAPAEALNNELKLATLVISNLSYAALTKDLTVGDLYIATNSANRLFLKGRTLKVNSYFHKDWGGDAWVVYDSGQIIWKSGTLFLVR